MRRRVQLHFVGASHRCRRRLLFGHPAGHKRGKLAPPGASPELDKAKGLETLAAALGRDCPAQISEALAILDIADGGSNRIEAMMQAGIAIGFDGCVAPPAVKNGWDKIATPRAPLIAAACGTGTFQKLLGVERLRADCGRYIVSPAVAARASSPQLRDLLELAPEAAGPDEDGLTIWHAWAALGRTPPKHWMEMEARRPGLAHSKDASGRRGLESLIAALPWREREAFQSQWSAFESSQIAQAASSSSPAQPPSKKRRL